MDTNLDLVFSYLERRAGLLITSMNTTMTISCCCVTKRGITTDITVTFQQLNRVYSSNRYLLHLLGLPNAQWASLPIDHKMFCDCDVFNCRLVGSTVNVRHSCWTVGNIGTGGLAVLEDTGRKIQVVVVERVQEYTVMLLQVSLPVLVRFGNILFWKNWWRVQEYIVICPTCWICFLGNSLIVAIGFPFSQI